jgi:hypothetical protein
MPGVAWRNRRRLAPLLLLVALLTAAPRSGGARPTLDASDHRTALDRAHALSVSDHAATAPTTDDRRPLPLGDLPTVLAAALLALLLAHVVREHRLSVGRRWSAFRRRAPPFLRIAS